MNYNKYIEYLTTKVKVYLKENKYSNNGCRIKYILEKDKSDTLIIVMSSCTRQGVKARYNYNRTLKNIKANKLFILDDFGTDSRGIYYLGKDGKFEIEQIVIELISKIKKELYINKTIYVGSSKGGYAALYFGLDDYRADIIVGAPQYYLGNYLDKVHPHILKYVMGDNSKRSINILNNLLPNRVNNNCNRNRIFLHYSDSEPTYFEHISFLIKDLEKNKFQVSVEKMNYTNHNSISDYFPNYLISSLDKIMEEK